MNSREGRDQVFAYARLSKADLLFMRLGGNGLGNLLFTWARALCHARRNRWRMIWPTWYSHKPKNKRVNPYDIRTYRKLFRPTSSYISGPMKWRHLLLRQRVSEAAADLRPGCVVEFRGMAGKFQPFLADLELVRAELLAMTREEHLAGFRAPNPAPIGIHVRRGDFMRRESAEETVLMHNSLLPLTWYIEVLESVRQRVGAGTPVFVFSDGNDTELAPLVSLENVKRAEFGSSIADLLALSRSKLLIASGSTFSQWATYLGQVPTIWHPGKLEQPLLLESPQREIQWRGGDPLPDWISTAEYGPPNW